MKHENAKVIIKKVRSKDHATHRNTSWKIAYADFMTAMMALFLVLWLIGKASPEALQQIAEYFRMPLRVAIFGEKNSESEEIIPGGGVNTLETPGEVQRTDISSGKESKELRTEGQMRRERMKMMEIQDRLEQMIELDPRLKSLRPHLLIDFTDQGLRIQIVDRENRPMFKVGSAEIEPHMRVILHTIAPILNDMPNKISLTGHTDDLPYANGERGYSNWELSADRANASRRELIAGGIEAPKILRVIGAGSTMHLHNPEFDDSVNRRISIVVLYQRVQSYWEKQDGISDDQIFFSGDEIDKEETPSSEQSDSDNIQHQDEGSGGMEELPKPGITNSQNQDRTENNHSGINATEESTGTHSNNTQTIN